MSDSRANKPHLIDLALLFLRLGTVAFGGPAAHIAMFREEVVERRKWITEQHFLDLLGATNLIPGPNSSEMSIHIGYKMRGMPGMIVSGLAWMTPAFLMVLGLSWVYMTYGSTPVADAILYGVKPVIIPIIIGALIKLGRKAVKGWLTGLVGMAGVVAYLLGMDVLLLIVLGGLVTMVIANLGKKSDGESTGALVAMLPGLKSVGALVTSFSVGMMVWTFFKVGLVLYGGGYTLFAFLQRDFVTRLGWLTEQQLIDAIAIGQMTPGPLFTTTTFIGYLLGYQFDQPPVLMAILATLGFYTPSFVLVGLSNPIIPRLRNSTWASAFLDGVNVAALGAMAGVTVFLGQAAYVDLPSILIGVAAAIVLFVLELHSAWLVIGGAVIGLIISLV